ncbi:DNA gyrase subunit A [Ignatzschineria ureiclastica]|uniref:DNA gyrase subunit A n=1 Tax=Ignatzschineria ureiclastica TaxID=472582 RepID=A0A2U2ACF8_9GAMM|nr:DNA gyrase subunit A [Ignatzschineria ureiclastica]PWD80307.1 DNA gyrase subunit A [Ignatzschineria ureiclastica]GHA02864.1 DNA gyrase subunit A [Ignatzschineria ureiclastica]
MSEFAKEIVPISLEEEMRSSYLDYAMSVIIGRALPDVRDGLKPVHRRILHSMNQTSNHWNKPYKKSARIVGDVMGKYHPHGDLAIYDSVVRMAQDFSLRYMLIDGQGNFGSIDGDSAAAMRYTEVRMSKIAEALLQDIEKETVDFVPNYDESESEPSVLPTRIPNLLVNGSSGIAVGMATNIPPHNLTETINASLALLHNSELTIDELMQYIPAPDFPTAGIINGTKGIREAYHTGRGRVIIRAKAEIEHDEKRGRDVIVITELPYQVNKARLIERIVELYREKVIEGIAPDGLRDESDKDGMRIVIELRRGEMGEVILNQLFKHTALQSSFGINMVAIDRGQPKLLNLKEVLEAFLLHRQEVITRRTIFDLKKARARAHLLEGLTVALANIDEMIQLIRTSATGAEAKERMLARTWEPGGVGAMLERAAELKTTPDGLENVGLIGSEYRLSEEQAQAILDMRLQRLTGLEQDKILEEYRGLLDTIRELIEILTNPDRLREVIEEELTDIRDNFGDARRTEIRAAAEDINLEDLIAEEDVVVTLSRRGYIKYQKLDEYRAQRRGGRGKSAAKVVDEDDVEHLMVVSTHAQLMCFSSYGKVYWLRAFELPEAGRGASGRPIINFLPLETDERITSILPVDSYDDDRYIFMATKYGVVKKTVLSSFASQRSSGLIAVNLDEGDELIGTQITNGQDDIMLFTNTGLVNRFSEENVRAMGRSSRGVKGISLSEGQFVITMMLADEEAVVLIATEHGYGKRTPIAEFTKRNRGGKGVIGIQTSERNGQIIGACIVEDHDEVMLISSNGVLVRTCVDEVSILGRNTQGVRLIRLDEGDALVGMSRIEENDADECDENNEANNTIIEVEETVEIVEVIETEDNTDDSEDA